MKIFYLITSLICISSVMNSKEIEDPVFAQAVREGAVHTALVPAPDLVSSHGYFKIGTSVFYQTAGAGKRSSNFSTYRGNDFALNVKVPLLFGGKPILPSLEYTRLFYSPIDIDAHKYSGVGIEVGVLLDKHRKAYPVINPKVVWGKEYLDGHFTQWSLNLLPALVFATALIDDIHHHHYHKHHFHQHLYDKKHHKEIVALGTMIEFSYGF